MIWEGQRENSDPGSVCAHLEGTICLQFYHCYSAQAKAATRAVAQAQFTSAEQATSAQPHVTTSLPVAPLVPPHPGETPTQRQQLGKASTFPSVLRKLDRRNSQQNSDLCAPGF